jgi:hypothetical protein
MKALALDNCFSRDRGMPMRALPIRYARSAAPPD